jgi:hypothetical protein
VRSAALAAILAACGPPEAAKPLRVAVRLHPAAVDGRTVRWSEAVAGIRAIRVQPCASQATTVDGLVLPAPWTTGTGTGVDLLDPRRERVPVGPWCGLDLVVPGPLVAVGRVGSDGPTISLRVALADLAVVEDVVLGAIEVTETPAASGGIDTRAEAVPLVVELGGVGWTSALDGLAADVVVEPGLPAHDALRDALLTGSSVWRDADRDGQVGDDERAEGPVALLAP